MTLQPSPPAASPEHPATPTPPRWRSTNGSTCPCRRACRGRGSGRRILWLVLPAASHCSCVASACALSVWFRGPQVRTDLVTYPVEYKDLQLKIVERGSLEAKENHDVKCEVKAGSRGAPKIKWVVETVTLRQARATRSSISTTPTSRNRHGQEDQPRQRRDRQDRTPRRPTPSRRSPST